VFKSGGLMTTKQSAAAGATSEGVLVRGSTPNTEVVHAAVAGGKVSARAVVAAVKKPVRQATKPHDEDLDKLAQLDAEQDLSTQAVADGERGANALLHRVSMVEAGSGSGVAAGDSAEDGAEGADAAPAAAAAASGGGGGGIGTLPLVLGGLAIAGGGAALAAGGGKKNSPPTVTPTQSVTTAEDTKATITVAASDADSDPLTYTTSNPTNGTVQATGGTIVYTPKPDFNGTDTFTVSVSDGKNPPVSQTVTVTVTAVNDVPLAVADVGAVVEDAVLTGTVATNDSDVDRDTLTYTLAAPVAGLTLAANGGYTFNAADAAYQNLAAGQTRAVVANYTVSDGKGGTAASTLTVTVTGVNDAPTVAATQAVAAAEDATSVAFTVAATDIDAGDAITFSAPAQSARGGSVTGGTGGNFVYVPLPDFNGADTVVVSVTDRAGAVSRQTVTFNVASNLAEVTSIDVANDSSAVTYDANGSGFTLGDNFKFTDNSAQPTNARIVNFAAGDTIEVTGASSSYSFTSVGSDLFITFNNSVAGVLNQIVLPGVARGFISDEASAESALGHDFFRALTNPVGGGTGVAGAGGDLDLDNDANIATTAIISAAGGNFAFTENANVANNARITGFGAGDSITVSNATAATYSFTSVGTDIVITANNAGVASQIVIAGVAAAGSFVTDEASAEASVGFNFFSLAASAGTGGTAAGTTSSQSIDNGSSLATLNAATGAINFTDDATKETNVVITNFASNDRISVSGASAGNYNFGTGDNGRDLIISFTNTQTNAVNSIVLDDALVGKSAFIFNYQSAAAALGFDFMVFG
jgi:VCBS repeat-containing protein